MFLKNSTYFKKNLNTYKSLNNYYASNNFFKIFILVDQYTKIYCLPHLLSCVNFLKQSEIIEIVSGEQEKNIYTCIKIWERLSISLADRKSLLINLGGGVITDMGGFIASVFKRGIPFINIPTTLLGMADASIGGKIGVDLNGFKNEVGLFKDPELLVIDPYYLKTLSIREIRSGMAEIFKHGLIADVNLWKEMKNPLNHSPQNWEKWIYHSIFLKEKITKNDPNENGLRKILNFGHTIGHAIETYFINNQNPILHGEAIILGIICESWLSYCFNGLLKQQYEEIILIITNNYPIEKNLKLDLNKILFIMKHDKKNKNGKIYFSLLKEIGLCSYDHELEENLIKESFFILKRIIDNKNK